MEAIANMYSYSKTYYLHSKFIPEDRVARQYWFRFIFLILQNGNFDDQPGKDTADCRSPSANHSKVRIRTSPTIELNNIMGDRLWLWHRINRKET